MRKHSYCTHFQSTKFGQITARKINSSQIKKACCLDITKASDMLLDLPFTVAVFDIKRCMEMEDFKPELIFQLNRI